MNGKKTHYLSNLILNTVFGNQAFPAFADIYVALFSTVPGPDGSGTEMSGGSYARVHVPGNVANWPVTTTQLKTNENQITFLPATTQLGTLAGIALYDSPTGGNMLYYCLPTGLDPAVYINIGNTFYIPAGGIVITES